MLVKAQEDYLRKPVLQAKGIDINAVARHVADLLMRWLTAIIAHMFVVVIFKFACLLTDLKCKAGRAVRQRDPRQS